VPAFTLKARSKAHRSSRIGRGSGTTPLGSATTTVTPSYGCSDRGATNRAPRPSAPGPAHGSTDPIGPT
jgi:hypothetical protein